MGVNVYPQQPSISRPENASSLVLGGIFTDGTYTATGTYPAGLYILKGYNLNNRNSTASLTFTNNNITYDTEIDKDKYIYLSTTESSISISPNGAEPSSNTATFDYQLGIGVSARYGNIVNGPGKDGFFSIGGFYYGLSYTRAYASGLTNKYVGVGPSGNITYSTDSVTWTAATTGTANLQDVIFAGGKYVAVDA